MSPKKSKRCLLSSMFASQCKPALLASMLGCKGAEAHVWLITWYACHFCVMTRITIHCSFRLVSTAHHPLLLIACLEQPLVERRPMAVAAFVIAFLPWGGLGGGFLQTFRHPYAAHEALAAHLKQDFGSGQRDVLRLVNMPIPEPANWEQSGFRGGACGARMQTATTDLQYFAGAPSQCP